MSRGSSAVQPGGEPVSDLHGLAHRLRSAGVRPHGHLYQVRQAHERVPHLPAVRDPSRARLPVLRARAGFCSALGDRAPGVWAHGGPADGKLTRKCAVFPRPGRAKMLSPLGMPVLLQRYTVRLAEPQASGNWYRSHRPVPVLVILG